MHTVSNYRVAKPILNQLKMHSVMALCLRTTTNSRSISALKPSLLENDNLVTVPNIYFKTYTFERKIIVDEKEINITNWNRGILVVNDGISGGAARTVEVLFYTKNSTTYLKAINKLEKHEYETLFGFGCGFFEINRVISVPSNILDIV